MAGTRIAKGRPPKRTSIMPSRLSPPEEVARVPVADSKVVVGLNPTLSAKM